MTCGVTFGLPSRSPPIQVPNVSGREVTGSVMPRRASSAARSSRTSGTASLEQLGEVVDGVARLVRGLGPVGPQLVGLPQQVDDFGQAPVEAAQVRGRLGGRGQQLRDLAQLGQVRPPRGLRGVRGEHRADAEASHLFAHHGGVEVGGGDAVDGLREPAAVLRAQPAQLVAAVHLLGDVRQVKVHRRTRGRASSSSRGRRDRAGRTRPADGRGSARGPPPRGRTTPGPPGGPASRRAGCRAGGCRPATPRTPPAPARRLASGSSAFGRG